MTITPEELKEIATSTPNATGRTPASENMGQCIIVLDRGFVYVGEVTRNGDSYTATKCKNIRRWGTTKGLGEIVNGPTASTTTDETGTIIFRSNVLNHLIPSKWML